MKKKYFLKGLISSALMLTMIFSGTLTAMAEGYDASSRIDSTSQYLINTVTNPQISSIGGEWAIIGLARSGEEIPETYYDKYYTNVVKELTEKDGVLTNVKYTEYSRLILALTAIGKDVTNVGGYNLLEKLADYNNVIKQGINGPIFALLAFDSNNYNIPLVQGVSKQTTREILIDYILNKEITDANGIKGGFCLSGTEADADITGMALQALANYKERPEVKAAIDRGLQVLEKQQLASGGFKSAGIENSESISQVIVAKSALGIDASENFNALVGYCINNGGIKHTTTGEVNQMSTEQGLYALVAYNRYTKGENALYDMTDVNKGIKVTINGKNLSFQQAPVNIDGSILVPMRSIFEALGADISWDGAARKVTGTAGGKTVELVIGSKTAVINGTNVELAVPARIVNNTTMVPVRFISESLNAKVEWQKDKNTVAITN